MNYFKVELFEVKTGELVFVLYILIYWEMNVVIIPGDNIYLSNRPKHIIFKANAYSM